MNTREILINDINSFLKEALVLYNNKEKIKKEEFLNLDYRLSNINVNDFNSEEDFDAFFRHINQDQRQFDRIVLVNIFSENNINNQQFLLMCNYLSGVVNWLE